MTILDSLVEGALCLGNRRESNELLGMMVRYLVTGEVPEPRTDAQRMAITMIMPVLENSRARAEAGRKGGLSRGVSVNIIFTISTNAFSPIAPTRIHRIRQRGCAAFGA